MFNSPVTLAKLGTKYRKPLHELKNDRSSTIILGDSSREQHGLFDYMLWYLQLLWVDDKTKAANRIVEKLIFLQFESAIGIA